MSIYYSYLYVELIILFLLKSTFNLGSIIFGFGKPNKCIPILQF